MSLCPVGYTLWHDCAPITVGRRTTCARRCFNQFNPSDNVLIECGLENCPSLTQCRWDSEPRFGVGCHLDNFMGSTRCVATQLSRCTLIFDPSQPELSGEFCGEAACRKRDRLCPDLFCDGLSPNQPSLMESDLSSVREWSLGTNTIGGVALLDVDSDGIDELVVTELAMEGHTNLVVYKIDVAANDVYEFSRTDRVVISNLSPLTVSVFRDLDNDGLKELLLVQDTLFSFGGLSAPPGIVFYLKRGTGEVKGTKVFPLSLSVPGGPNVPVGAITRNAIFGPRRVDTYDMSDGTVSVYGGFVTVPCERAHCPPSFFGRVALVFYWNNAADSGKSVIDESNERTLVLGFLRDSEPRGEFEGGGLYYDETITTTRWAGVHGGAFLGDLDGDGAPDIMTGDFQEGSLLVIGTRLDEEGRIVGDPAKTTKFTRAQVEEVFGGSVNNFGWSFGSVCADRL
ncbi:MAG: hypothetical protein MHM6MM_000945 [Cercozoa sp. M6MM]